MRHDPRAAVPFAVLAAVLALATAVAAPAPASAGRDDPIAADSGEPAVASGAAPEAGGPAAANAEASGPRPAQADQDPEVPALYDDTRVRDVSMTFEQDDWLALLQANGCRARGGPGQPATGPAQDVPVTLVVDGTRLERVGVRCKGNSSLGISGSKKPFNLTIDAFEAGQDLWGFDVINLNNNFSDPSQLRDAIALKLLGQYMPVSRFTFARVTIQGQYIGLYSMVEQMNGEWADHWFDDGGLIIRGDSPVRIAFDSSTLNWKGEDLAPYKQGYEVKGKDAGSDEGYVELRELIRALDAPVSAGGLSDAGFKDGIRRAMNVDSALWHIAGTSILAHYDSYYVGKNFYLFRGTRDPRFNIHIWDLGLAFGTFGFRSGNMGGGPGGAGTNPATVDPFAQVDAANRPLIRRLLAVPEYRADYLAHYRALLDEVFTEDWMLEVGQTYQDLVRDAAQAEEAAQGKISGSFTFAQFLQNLREPITPSGGGTGRPGGFGLSAPGILALVRERGAYLRARPDMQTPDLRLAGHALSPEAPTTGEAVTVRATFGGADAAALGSVEVRYRVAGGYEEQVPMAREGDGWAAVIPAQRAGKRVTYAFRTAIDDGRASFFPAANWTGPFAYEVGGVDLPPAAPGDLVLNELMADNTSTIADEAGEYEDWVELYNRGTAPVSLAGLYLSDDPTDPWVFALPDRTLAPGEHVLVWCDGDAAQGPLHAPFALSRQGETVVVASRAEIVDQVTYASLGADESFGRATSGADGWVRCGYGTPGRTNGCDASVPTATPPPTARPTEPAPTARPTEVPPTATPSRRVFLPWAAHEAGG